MQRHDAELLPVVKPTLSRLPVAVVHDGHEQYECYDEYDVTLPANEHVVPAHGVAVLGHGQHDGHGRGDDGRHDAGNGRTAGMDGRRPLYHFIASIRVHIISN